MKSAHRKLARGKLDRRTVLRGTLAGLGVTVGLPRLDAMLDGRGVAYAGGSPLPRCFGLWGWGNGVDLKSWVPTKEGAGYDLPPQLAPLAPVQDYMTVVSGMTVKTTSFRAHCTTHMQLITGVSMAGSRDPDLTAGGPTIDQIVAAKIGAGTPLKSIEVGVDNNQPPEGGSAFRWWSHSGRNSPNPQNFSCRSVFNTLFGERATPGTATSPDLAARAARLRKSVLDVVLADSKGLGASLGAADRMRLDQHLDGIRALEVRLDALDRAPAPGAACAAPPAPDMALAGGAVDYDVRGREVNQTMAQLVALALSCDTTRVFTFVHTQPGSHLRSSKLGITGEYHILTHNEWNSARVSGAIRLIMSELNVFVATLKNMREGAGSLLDRCAIFACSDVSQGDTHGETNFPMLLFGKAGGLKAGTHYRSRTAENACVVPFTAAVAAGSGLTEFGDRFRRVTQPHPSLIA